MSGTRAELTSFAARVMQSIIIAGDSTGEELEEPEDPEEPVISDEPYTIKDAVATVSGNKAVFEVRGTHTVQKNPDQ